MPLTLSRLCQAIAPSLTLAMDARAKEMAAQGKPVIGFGVGEPNFDTPTFIRDAAKEALDRGMTRYTPVAGTLELRKAICEKLARDNGLTYAPSQILVSNGAKHSLYTACQALIDPGDEVLIPSPWWVSYPEMVRMCGGVPVQVPTTEATDFVATAAMMAPLVTPKTKLLILNSPNNPNGSVWTRAQLQEIAALAVEKQFYILADEIYEKLIYDGYEHVSIASLGEQIYNQTIVVNGMSKAYAMTGWRIGYAAGPQGIINAMSAHQSHATSNPNAMAQHASIAALRGDQQPIADMVAAFDARRQALVAGINGIDGVSAKMPHGAFYVMMNIQQLLGKHYAGKPIKNSMEFADALLGAKYVAVVPGAAFEADGFCRLSYALSMEHLNEGVRRIADFVAELKD